MYSTVANAELALLLEVAGTPKPGNVDRERDLEDLHFEHFLAGAVGARPGLDALADPTVGLGDAFERAVAGMSAQSGGNTQFGALLALAPLVRAAATTGDATTGDATTDDAEGAGPTDELSRDRVREVVAATTVNDAAGFYRAFDHVDVFVDDPPDDLADLDVRRGSGAVPAVRDRQLTLGDLMAESAGRDGIAAEWTTGFERTFEAASAIAAGDGPLSERGADAFLVLLADEPDTLVADRHGDPVAREVTERARGLLEDARHRTDAASADHGAASADHGAASADHDLGTADRDAVRAFADDLVARGVNPGTTADLTAAALFVALERHEVRP